jgi:hypothetical protein
MDMIYIQTNNMIHGVDSYGLYDEKAKQINYMDRRFYYSPKNDKYFINLTTVIKDGGPVGKHLIDWYKQVGYNADTIMERAGQEGTAVHDLVDKSFKGIDVSMIDETGKYLHTVKVWQMFLKAIEFRDTHKPYIYANEVIFISNILKVGMTIDLVCEINGEMWIVDFKTSNYISKEHFIQVAVCAFAWNEFFPHKPIQRVGLLHLKADTKGPDKKGKKIQGKGWQLVEPPKHYDKYIDSFKRRYAEWEEDNPDYKPSNYYMKTHIKGYKFDNEIITGQIDSLQSALLTEESPTLFLQ